MQCFPISKKNVSPDLLSLGGEWRAPERTGNLLRVYALEWGAVARVRIILQNTGYTIRVTWALCRIRIIVALVQPWRRSYIFNTAALSFWNLQCEGGIPRAWGGSGSQELFLNFIWLYRLYLSLYFLFKSILGDCCSTEQIWGTIGSDMYFVSVAHHLFCIFSSNKDGSCLFSLAVLSDVAQGLGMDRI